MKRAIDYTLVQNGMHFDPSRGGADRYFNELLRALAGAGVTCDAAAFGDVPAQSPHRLTSLGPDDAPLPTRLCALHRFGQRILRTDSPTVFAWHFGLYGWAALPRHSQCGTVAHFHGPWAEESRAEGASHLVVLIKRWIEGRALKNANRVIVLSAAFRDLVRSQFSIPGERICIVPPAVDFERFQRIGKHEARDKLGWPQNGPIVFCLRRMVHRMGIEELIRAWAEISRDHPSATLVLAGSGSLLPDLKELSRNMGHAGSRILFTGRLADDLLPCAYSAADFSIVPSRALEGFGLVALESLACGTPPMVTPVGGLPEVVGNLDPALVLSSASSDSLAEGLRGALCGVVRLPGSDECRSYAEKNFSPVQLASRVLEVYADSLKDRGKK